MMVLSMMIVHTVGIFVLGMSLVVVMMMPMLILPGYLFVMAYHRSVKMMIRVRVVVTAMPVAIYIRALFLVVVLWNQFHTD